MHFSRSVMSRRGDHVRQSLAIHEKAGNLQRSHPRRAHEKDTADRHSVGVKMAGDKPVGVLQSGHVSRWLLVPRLGVLIRIDQATCVMRRMGLACSFEPSGNEGS